MAEDLGEQIAEPGEEEGEFTFAEEGEIAFGKGMEFDLGYEDEFYEDESAAPSGLIPGMLPWQGLVVAFLLCLNVAVLGCLALLAAGKIALPLF